MWQNGQVYASSVGLGTTNFAISRSVRTLPDPYRLRCSRAELRQIRCGRGLGPYDLLARPGSPTGPVIGRALSASEAIRRTRGTRGMRETTQPESGRKLASTAEKGARCRSQGERQSPTPSKRDRYSRHDRSRPRTRSHGVRRDIRYDRSLLRCFAVGTRTSSLVHVFVSEDIAKPDAECRGLIPALRWKAF